MANNQGKGVFWKLSVAVLPESEEAIAELLQTIFGEPSSVYTDAETEQSMAEVYLPNRPADSLLANLQARIKAAELPLSAGEITVTRLKRQDWAESWKAHFKPIRIGHRLLIRPSWSKEPARRRQAVVVLDPGLGFGTGQHATTRFCLEQMVAHRVRDAQQSFLDIGTGSGILAITAAKLGYAPVEALDSDPDAVRIALANARRNRVYGKVRIRCGDLAKIARPNTKFDLVCANLTADLLLRHQARIVRQIRRGGHLALAGILERQFAEIEERYQKAGLKLAKNSAKAGWKSGLFVSA